MIEAVKQEKKTRALITEEKEVVDVKISEELLDKKK